MGQVREAATVRAAWVVISAVILGFFLALVTNDAEAYEAAPQRAAASW
jgi:hypothetical protein